jgi:outer membrane cobalamin receptor
MNSGSGLSIRYQECRSTFEDKMKTEQHHENILNNVATLLLKDLNADFSILKHLHVRARVFSFLSKKP